MASFTNPYSASGPRIAFDALLRSLDELGVLDGDDRPPEEKLDETHVAIAQGLFWAATIDDLLRQDHPGYEEAREADRDGRAMGGAQLVRNAVTHGSVIVHSIQPGLRAPFVVPFDVGGIRWRPLGDILETWAPRQSRRLEAQKESYAFHFAGRQTRFGIGVLPSWFARAAERGFTLGDAGF